MLADCGLHWPSTPIGLLSKARAVWNLIVAVLNSLNISFFDNDLSKCPVWSVSFTRLLTSGRTTNTDVLGRLRSEEVEDAKSENHVCIQ